MVATVANPEAFARSGGDGSKGESVKYFRCRHEVLPGETLRTIARRYGVSVSRLRAVNGLEGDSIRAGRKLGVVSRLPCLQRFRTVYVVQAGDSWKSIASKHRVSSRQLRALNESAGARLMAGQKLVLVVEGPGAKGKGNGFLQLDSGPGYVVRDGGKSWGTRLAVSRLIEVLSDHQRRHPRAPPIRVDDISRRGGGRLAPHVSHRNGRDVDIRYPLLEDTDTYIAATPEHLDVPRTWDLIRGFLETGDTVYIFVGYRLQKVLYEHAQQQGVKEEQLKEWFQYPRGKRSMTGIIRHEPGHRTHLHVRFRPEERPERPNS